MNSARPLGASPIPVMILTASAACIEPMTPAAAPSTGTPLQRFGSEGKAHLRQGPPGRTLITWPVNPSTAQLFIADPLRALSAHARGGGMGGLGRLFSTHPPIAERIERLTEMAQGIR